MKLKNTLVFALMTFIFGVSFGQTLNQAANWPNASWTVSGTYNALYLNDPVTTTNFGYDEDAAGSGTDIIFCESAVIDLTAASGAGETWISVDFDYDHYSSDLFQLEWYDADAASWVTWESLPDNSTNLSGWCAAITAPIVTSQVLDIAGFTPTQLSGFRYRFHWESSIIWGWGFCVSSPTIYSATPPTCLSPTNLSGIFTAPDMIFLDWTPGGTETAWTIEYGTAGFTQGTGTTDNVTSYPHTINGVPQNSLIDIYIQADCGGGDLSTWAGPITVSTLANDDACNAQVVAVDSSTVNYSNIGATTQTSEPGSSPNNTVWFKAEVPASGHMAISTCGTDFDSELEVFTATDCSDFGTYTSLGYADWNPWSCAGSHPAGIELCGLTPGDTVLFWVGSYFSGTTGTFPLTVWELTSNAGTGSLAEMCVSDTVDLWQYVTGNDDMSGYWDYPSNPSAIIGSQFVAGNSTFAGDTVYYIINNACDADTASVAIDVYGVSQAGGDGAFTVCLNQPYDLYSGLTGTVDIGGSWYDPSNNVVNSQQNAPNIPGQFNFDYIVSNGFCPADTSNIVVTVSSGCDWLNVEELYFEGVEVYPNPATQNIFISNTGSDEVFSYEMTDTQGKVIATKENAINGTKATEINIEQLETGLYLIKVYNENAAKTFRIVKH